jgi:hypothetical protein
MKTLRRISQTILLPQSSDCSYYSSKRILTPQPLWLQKYTDLRAHGFAYSTDLWHQLRLAKVTCAWIWKLFGINTAILFTDYETTTAKNAKDMHAQYFVAKDELLLPTLKTFTPFIRSLCANGNAPLLSLSVRQYKSSTEIPLQTTVPCNELDTPNQPPPSPCRPDSEG